MSSQKLSLVYGGFFYGLWTQDQCICNMSDVKNMLHMVREKGGRERERGGGRERCV